MNFGNRLLKLRKQKSISQETLAEKIGITRQTVSNWEMNITTPNVIDLKKIADALQIDYTELLNDINSENDKDKEKNISKDESNDIKKIIKIFKIIGFIFMLGIIISLVALIAFKIKYDKTNIIGSDSVRCTYSDSIYTYSISYNKKHQIVNVEVSGQTSESTSKIEWITSLSKFATSKEITNPNTLILYITEKYKENNGHCS